MSKNCNCHRNTCRRDWKCKSRANQLMDINTPVRVEPIVDVGRIKTVYRRPRICFHTKRPNCCKCACEFIIKQTIDVEIPICYDVDVDIGNSYVDCKFKEER